MAFVDPDSYSNVQLDPDFQNKILPIEGGTDKSGKFLTSKAGAIGPAQVMPSTAKEAAQDAGLPYSEHLYKTDKDYNAAIGNAYYKKLVNIFQGDTEKAAAAYNAGATKVKSIIETHGENWREHLPEETKGYVQKFAAKSKPSTGFVDPDAPTKSKGFVDPDAVTITSKPQSTFRDVSAPEAFAEHTIAGIPVSAGAYAGMTGGAALGEELGAPFGPVGMVAGPVIGGAIGMFGAGYGADKLMRAVQPKVVNDLLDQGAKQHPLAAFAGDIASYAPVGGVGIPKTIVTESGKTISAAKQIALLTTGGAGLETGRELATGETLDPGKIAINALATPLMAGEPTRLGKAVTFEGVRKTESKEMLTDLQDKLHGTSYEEKLNNHITEQQKMETFEDYKHKESIQGSLFEDPSLKKTDAQLKEEYDNRIRTRAEEAFLSEHPEVDRPNVNLAKAPTNDAETRDFFFNFAGAKTQDNIIANHILRLAGKDKLSPESRENIRKFSETGAPLNEADQAYYDRYFKESLSALRKNLSYLMDKGLITKTEMGADFFPRMLNPLDRETLERLRKQGLIDEEPSLWGAIKEKLGGRDFGAQDVQMPKSAAQERALFTLESPNGRREVIHVTKNNKVIVWKDGKGRILADDAKSLTDSGSIKSGDKILGGTVKEGSIEEIEQHSPYRYNKDSLAVLLNKLNESREMVRAHAMIEDLKNTDYFKNSSHKIESGVEMPEGYVRPKYLDRLPALEGYAFPARTAWLIEDFARVRNPNLMTEMSGMIVKNMMLNPLPHIFNEAMHLYNARGLTGWVSPAGIKRFATGVPDALRSVLTQDEFYRDTLKYNGSLMAPSTRASALEEAIGRRSLNEFAQGGGLKELARYFGRSALDMYDGISKASNKAMWIARDVMYMQYVKEIMNTKGLTHELAIKQAERHLPNYRLPETIGDSVLGAKMGRVLSETLQNPNVSVFSRYHYGMLKSIMETMKDVGAIRKGAEGMQEFKEGVNTLAATVLALSALYPLMDMLAQQLTGDPTAKQRRAGPYHLAHAISEVADGSKDPQAVLSAVFTFNPALVGLIQLGLDRNLYNGQHIYNPMSSPDVIAMDVGKYSLGQMPMGNQFMKAENDQGDSGWASLLARQTDIESKGTLKAVKQQKTINKLEKEAMKYDIKRREGLK
jgi:Transglycosylase SLT domain